MKRKIFIGIGVVLGVALLAGAAFMAVRLLNTQTSANGPGAPLAGLGGPGGGKTSIQIQMTPAPELPSARADLVGQVTNIQDNSIFVAEMSKASGGVANQVIVGKAVSSGGGSSNDSGPVTNSEAPTPSGPTTEVVVSQNTIIYRDTTMDSVPRPQPGSSTSIGVQQVLEAADISSISDSSMVQVWGQKRGDRLIADTIVVMGTAIIQSSGGK
jgi:hypothetical protein